MLDYPNSADNVGGTPPIQLSAQYGAVTLRFYTTTEAENTLLMMRNSDDPVLKAAAEAVSKNLNDLLNAKPGTAPSSASASAPAASKPTSDKTCPHGQRNLVTGENAKGKWVGHFCPLDKGDPNQCKPIFGK